MIGFLIAAALWNVTCSSGIPIFEVDLTREGFLDEIVYSQATQRTHQFDDYTWGSYHVDKLDLLVGARGLSLDAHPNLVGLITLGPFGPLWQYNIVAFIREDRGIRVNWLAMPHARITAKGTKFIPVDEFEEIKAKYLESAALEQGEPQASAESPNAIDVEWSFGGLVVFWSPDEDVFHIPGTWYESQDSPEIQSFLDLTTEVTQDLTITYSASLPEPRTLYRDMCSEP